MCNCLGGGSQPQQSTSNSLDPDIKSRLLGALDQGINASNLPYQGYGGQRIAGFTPDQQAGFDQARQAATWSQGTIQHGIDAANAASTYQPNQVSGTSYDPTLASAASMAGVTGTSTNFDPSQFNPVSAERVGTTTLPQAGIGAYMNPYMTGVIDPAMAEIDRQSDMQQQKNKGAAALAGAFGGDRAAIVDTETQRNAQALKNQTIAGLYNTGYNTATGLAETDLARALQASTANQGAGLQAGLANTGYGVQIGTQNQNAANQYGLANMANLQQANLTNSGYQQQTNLTNAAAQTAAAQYKAQQDYLAQVANQQAGISAAGLNLQGASTLGNLGALQQQTQLTGANALAGIGAQQQGLNQTNLNTAYQDFLEQRGYPMQQAQSLAGIAGGYPVNTATTSTTQLPAPSLTGQLAGLGTAGLGLYGLSKMFADGGRVGYKRGGEIDIDDPEYLDEFDPLLGGSSIYDAPAGPTDITPVYTRPAGPPMRTQDMRGAGGSLLPGQVSRALSGIGDWLSSPRGQPMFTGDGGTAIPYDPPGYSEPPPVAGIGPLPGARPPSYIDRDADIVGNSDELPVLPPQAGIGAPAPVMDQGGMGTGDPMVLPPMPEGPPPAPGMPAGPAGPSAPAGAPPAMPPPRVGVPPGRGAPGAPSRAPVPVPAPRPPVDLVPGGAGAGAPMLLPREMTPIDDTTKGVSEVLAKGVKAPQGSKEIPEWAIPLAMAGFSMMASRSPRALESIGQGGVAALQSYAEQRKLKSATELKKAQLENTAEIQRGNLDARRETTRMNEQTRRERTQEMAEAARDRVAAQREAAADRAMTAREAIAARAQAAADNLALREQLGTDRIGTAKTPEEREADRQARIDDQARKIEDTVVRLAPRDAMGNPQITPEVQKAAQDAVIQRAPKSTAARTYLDARVQQAPPAAVAALKADPKLAPQFEAKYGLGTAAYLLGR